MIGFEQTLRRVSLAADSRLGAVDPYDDQVWQLRLGENDRAGLMLQSGYGGRVGLSSIVLVWTLDGYRSYRTSDYEEPPIITRLTPGLCTVEAMLTPDIHLALTCIVAQSNVLAGEVSVTSRSRQPVSLDIELYWHIGAQMQELKLTPVRNRYFQALCLVGQIADIEPAFIQSDAVISDKNHPVTTVSLTPNRTVTIDWVHIGARTWQASAKEASLFLKSSWKHIIDDAIRAGARLPHFETGNDDRDTALNLSAIQMVQAVVADDERARLVTARAAEGGFSRRHGSDYPRSWRQVDIYAAYLALPSLQAIWPQAVAPLLSAVLAPVSGKGDTHLTPPIVAALLQRLSLTLDDATRQTMAERVQQNILGWLDTRNDADGDSFPEWQNEQQIGYRGFPASLQEQQLTHNTTVGYFESPSMLAQMLAATALLQQWQQAGWLSEPARDWADLHRNLVAIADSLLRDGSGFAYRDRDTHQTQPPIVLLDAMPGDQQAEVLRQLDVPSRLSLRVTGGVNHVPDVRLMLTGSDRDGEPVSRAIGAGDMVWHRRNGFYTTPDIFSSVDRLTIEGLSRVYTVTLTTFDTEQFDLSSYLPLWAIAYGYQPHQPAETLTRQLIEGYLAPHGLTMRDLKHDKATLPSDDETVGGIHIMWQVMMIEGLRAGGQHQQAAALLKTVMETISQTLATHESFYRFYDAYETRGYGSNETLYGLVPVHLVLEFAGVHISEPGTVHLDPAFPWDEPISISQHGVTVSRSRDRVTITTGDGNTRTIDMPIDAPRMIELGDTVPGHCVSRRIAFRRSAKQGLRRPTLPTATPYATQVDELTRPAEATLPGTPVSSDGDAFVPDTSVTATGDHANRSDEAIDLARDDEGTDSDSALGGPDVTHNTDDTPAPPAVSIYVDIDDA